MRIKQIHIQNFKSLVDFKLENLPQFCAFVGPNASGKSNIFEALEFCNYFIKYRFETTNIFGGADLILSFNPNVIKDDHYPFSKETINQAFEVIFDDNVNFEIRIHYNPTDFRIDGFGTNSLIRIQPNEPAINIFDVVDTEKRKRFLDKWVEVGNVYETEFEILIDNFSRIFVGKSDLKRINQSSTKLLIDASNLSQIIGQIFQDEKKREDFIEWLKILIPEFENIIVKKSNIDGSFEFFVYEKSSPSKPFPVKLLSDGTKNILALMAAVYQSNQPQFLCIEEPENGLHPQAIELLVEFFRIKCEEEGHHIWLNTHSQTLVRSLDAEEIILVNKVDGKTKAKQLTKEDSYGLKSDEAWLSNAFGGGVL